MKRNSSQFIQQFADVTPQKRARRDRFMRKVAGRRQHLQAQLRHTRRLISPHRLNP